MTVMTKMTRALKSFGAALLLTALTAFSGPAQALPHGFFVANQGYDFMEFRKTERGRVTVILQEYRMNGRNFSRIVREVAEANGSSSCTKMKDTTPIGGPRFHCQYNLDRPPYTLHLIPYYEDGFVLSVVIYGDSYPGFGITYDDVRDLIRYWFRY